MAASEPSSASYCAHVAVLSEDNVHRNYHDTQYGFPVHSDDELFGRLLLRKQVHLRFGHAQFLLDCALLNLLLHLRIE